MKEPVKRPVAKRMFWNAFIMSVLAAFLYGMSGMANKGSVINQLQLIFPIVSAAGWMMTIGTAIIEFRESRKAKKNSESN